MNIFAKKKKGESLKQCLSEERNNNFGISFRLGNIKPNFHSLEREREREREQDKTLDGSIKERKNSGNENRNMIASCFSLGLGAFSFWGIIITMRSV